MFDIWLQLDRLIRSKRVNEGRIQTNLSSLPHADYRSRYVRLESTVTVTFQVTDKVELQIDLLLSNYIGRRNIEERTFPRAKWGVRVKIGGITVSLCRPLSELSCRYGMHLYVPSASAAP